MNDAISAPSTCKWLAHASACLEHGDLEPLVKLIVSVQPRPEPLDLRHTDRRAIRVFLTRRHHPTDKRRGDEEAVFVFHDVTRESEHIVIFEIERRPQRQPVRLHGAHLRQAEEFVGIPALNEFDDDFSREDIIFHRHPLDLGDLRKGNASTGRANLEQLAPRCPSGESDFAYGKQLFHIPHSASNKARPST